MTSMVGFEIILGYLLAVIVISPLCGKGLGTGTSEFLTRENRSFATSYNTNLLYQPSFSVDNLTHQDVLDRVNITKFLVDTFEDRINRFTILLEVTSREPAVRNISFASMISTEFMGIPKNSDVEKRKIADSLLHEPGLGSVYFTLPNGDVYLGEPYLQQQQLPRLNFADRDWYKGVITSNVTYISSVFISASIHVPTIAIAVPVFQDNHNMTLLGHWVGIVNIGNVWKSIKNNYATAEELIVIDDEGTIIFASGQHNYSDIKIRSPLSSNNSGVNYDKATLKKLEGNLLAVSYPIKIGSRNWIFTTIK